MDVHLKDMKATYGNIVLLSLIEQVLIPLNRFLSGDTTPCRMTTFVT